jgi:hypothetical protein
VVHAVVVIHVVQPSVAQEAQLGAPAAEIAMAIVHIAEGRRAPVMWAQAHIRVVPLTLAQNAVAPLGALVVHMVSAVTIGRTCYHTCVHLAILRICDTRALDAPGRGALTARPAYYLWVLLRFVCTVHVEFALCLYDTRCVMPYVCVGL